MTYDQTARKKKSKFLQLLVESASQSPGAARGRSTVKAMTANLTPRRTLSQSFKTAQLGYAEVSPSHQLKKKEKKGPSNPGKKKES